MYTFFIPAETKQINDKNWIIIKQYSVWMYMTFVGDRVIAWVGFVALLT